MIHVIALASPLKYTANGFLPRVREGVVGPAGAGSGWRLVDHVMGPTDVCWYGGLDRYGLSEKLFTK